MDFSLTQFAGDPPSKIVSVRDGGQIWQAGRPIAGDLRTAGVDLLVLCAIEWPMGAEAGYYQAAEDAAFPGVDVLVAPNCDDGSPFTVGQQAIAQSAASAVASAMHIGKKNVLVTCLQGLNRSGLVTALALVRIFKLSGVEAIERVRAARKDALCNPYFVSYLQSIK